MTQSDGSLDRSPTSYRSLRDANRGGGLYSDWVSQRWGSAMGAAIGRRVHPTIVTVSGLVVGVVTAVVAVTGVGHHPSWVVGGLALLGWQFAYALDCTDGQLARATGRTSGHGARVDVLVDYAVQTGVVAAVVTAVQHDHRMPPWVLTAFATVWFINLFVFALSKTDGTEGHSLITRRTPVVAVLKISRDYGFVVLLVGLAFAFWRPGLRVLVWATLVVNGLFLLASISWEARASIQAAPRGPANEPRE